MNKQTYYFIGINGIGMSGLAEILAKKGHHVLGSDIAPSLKTFRIILIIIIGRLLLKAPSIRTNA